MFLININSSLCQTIYIIKEKLINLVATIALWIYMVIFTQFLAPFTAAATM